MTPTFRKVALIAAVLGFAVSVAVAACGGDGDDEAAPPTTQPPPTTTEAPPTTTDEPSTVTTPPITGPGERPDTGQTIRITVVGGRPKGGIQRPKVDQDERVTLLVRSDVTDHVHLHGYDLMADAGPGKTARIVFTADVPGRFEIELEDRATQIAELTVEP